MTKYVIGVDIGGTKIATGLANESGKILETIVTPTKANKGSTHVTEKITKSIYYLLDNYSVAVDDLLCISLGVPGPIDIEKGLVIKAPNIPGWEHYPLVEDISFNFPDIKILLENDANCAGFGELIFGSAKEFKDILFVTISTGIGGALIFDRKLYHGKNNIAGEVGHMAINLSSKSITCGCGREGCFEAYASGTAMALRAQKKIKKIKIFTENYGKPLMDIIEGDPSKITSYTINQALNQGDEFAKEMLSENCYYISIGLINIINTIDVEAIIIGGGLSNFGDDFFDCIISNIKNNITMTKELKTKIIPASLGVDAGIIGTIAVGLYS